MSTASPSSTALAAQPASEAQCFAKLNNTIVPLDGWRPCGPSDQANSATLSCCSSADLCLSDGLCHYASSKLGGSGYYVAGCTDNMYSSDVCPQRCNNHPVKDAVFVSQPARLWKCCGAHPVTGQPWCDKPTEENFDAKRPGRLETLWQAGVGPATATATASAVGTGGHEHDHGHETATPSATPTDLVAATNMSGISPAMAGGIAAATAVGTLLFSLLVIHFFQRRQRREVRETVTAEARFESGALARAAIMGDGQGRGGGRGETAMRSVSSLGAEQWPLKDGVGKMASGASAARDGSVCELPAYNHGR